jgi:uncharacterized membrane protein YuzA (DUF378 family)
MNKTGTGLVGKILLGVVLLFVVLSGFNNFLVGLSTVSLIRMITPSSALGMRIIYVLMSLATLLTAILLFLKVYMNKD